MAKGKQLYFNFPIILIQDLFTNKSKALNNIFDVAIYNSAKRYTNDVSIELFISSAKHHGVTLGNNKNCFKNAVLLTNSIDGKCATAGISKEMLFDYYKNEKTERQLLQLACFLAIKSIIGTKSYCKTNKALIHARLFGYSSINDVPSIKGMTDLQYKYFAHDGINKYQIDRLIESLELQWHLKLISDHSKGFYLSFDLSLEQLAEIEQDKKKSNKLKLLKDAKAMAIAKAKSK
jgi:hypothetical protein